MSSGHWGADSAFAKPHKHWWRATSDEMASCREHGCHRFGATVLMCGTCGIQRCEEHRTEESNAG